MRRTSSKRKGGRQLAGQSVEALFAECDALLRRGAADRVIAEATRRLKAEPATAALHLMLGRAHLSQGDGGKAVAALEAGIAACGSDPRLSNALGRGYCITGEIDKARETFVAIEPDALEASSISAYFEVLDFDPPEPLFARAAAALELGGTSRRDFQHLAAALARAQHRRGAFDDAFATIRRLNLSYPAAASQRHADAFARLGEGVRRDALPLERETPRRAPTVFIIGLPRSGSTLLSQILGAHGDCLAIGESPAFMQAQRATVAAMRDAGAKLCSLADANQQMAHEDLRLLRRRYFRAVEATGARPGKRWLIDKNLSNYRRVPFILRAMPEARLIHVFRHPLDCLFSIMRLALGDGHGYKRDDLSLTGHFLDYAALMDLYADRYPGRLLSVCHEDLVADFEVGVRRLLEALGLGWDERCLAPESASRSVMTASAVQVRVGVNAEGVGRWRSYERQLQPLIGALGGMASLEERYARWRERAL